MRSNVFIFLFFLFSSFASLFDIRKSDSQNSSGEEANIYIYIYITNGFFL